MPVSQLLHYNSGCALVPLSPRILTTSPGTVSVGGEFFFYSNNPEPIGVNPLNPELADNGYWLLKADVTGIGRVFLWHQNRLTTNINEALVIFNPNTSDIQVDASFSGVIPPGDGVDAWYQFRQHTGPSTRIAAGQFGRLFQKVVGPGQIYGVVATIGIRDLQFNPASAVLYDLAWLTNSGGATAPAPVDGTSRVRGLGNGYSIG